MTRAPSRSSPTTFPCSSLRVVPNFYEFGNDVLYEIHVDNDNDADADITYQFQFNTVLTDTGPNDIFLYNTGQITRLASTNWNRKQFYSVTRVDRQGSHPLGEDLPCPPCNVGRNSIPDYGTLTSQAIHPLGSGGKVFAGQRAESFFFDLGSVFDLGDLRPFQHYFAFTPGATATAGLNALAGLNVHSIAIQVPIGQLTADGTRPSDYKASDSTLGIWTTASRQKAVVGGFGGFGNWQAGPWVQVSRLAMPVINEVIIPMGQKDYWNSQRPADDVQFSDLLRPPDARRRCSTCSTRECSRTSPPTARTPPTLVPISTRCCSPVSRRGSSQASRTTPGPPRRTCCD